MKNTLNKKLFLAIFIFVLSFSLSYGKTENTKSLKQHADFLDQYVVYNYDGGQYVVFFQSPTILQLQEISNGSNGKTSTATYGFTDLGNQIFFITWVDDDGNSTSQVLNAKKSIASVHTVDSKTQKTTATAANAKVTVVDKNTAMKTAKK